MTSKPFRSNSDRQMVVQHVVTTFGRLMTAGHTAGHLRSAMYSHMESAMKGTAYDRVGGRSADQTSPTERQALTIKGDKAHDDSAQMDRDLHTLRDIERRWYHWGLEYAIYETGDRGKSKPGEGTAPVGSCVICWDYGAAELVAEGRYKRYCLWCGEWKSAHGEKPPRPLWETHRQGKRVTTADVRKHAPHLLKDQAS